MVGGVGHDIGIAHHTHCKFHNGLLNVNIAGNKGGTACVSYGGNSMRGRGGGQEECRNYQRTLSRCNPNTVHDICYYHVP